MEFGQFLKRSSRFVALSKSLLFVKFSALCRAFCFASHCLVPLVFFSKAVLFSSVSYLCPKFGIRADWVALLFVKFSSVVRVACSCFSKFRRPFQLLGASFLNFLC